LSEPDRWVQPVTLEGRFVRLEPLALGHVERLAQVGLDAEIWRWMPQPVASSADMRALVEDARAETAAGRQVAFVIVERASGRPVGSTRYLSIDSVHRRLEIGWTWLARPWQRSAFNREAKLLLMAHAFDELGALRVEFKTDARNEQSRRALVGIGAVEEGTLRQHMLTFSGRRDSVYYSVIAEEWPTVCARLESRLADRTADSASQ
jgi:N-acetyltransferase